MISGRRMKLAVAIQCWSLYPHCLYKKESMLNIVNSHNRIFRVYEMGFSNLNHKFYVILYGDRKKIRESEQERRRERERGASKISSSQVHNITSMKSELYLIVNGSKCLSLLIYQRNNDIYNLRTVLFLFSLSFTHVK